MDLREPIRSVIPSVTGSVLAALARAAEPLTGRELEQRVKPAASHRGVQLALKGLVDGGIVERVDKGRAALYSLNRDHVAAPAIVALASMRDAVFARMKDAIGSWEPKARNVTVFGSFARGDAGVAGDIDLLVVRRNDFDDDAASDRQLAELTANVQRWSGNPLRAIVLTEDELAEQFAAREAYLEAAAAEGITLIGTPLRRMRASVMR